MTEPFVKVVNKSKLFTIFLKNHHHRCLTGIHVLTGPEIHLSLPHCCRQLYRIGRWWVQKPLNRKMSVAISFRKPWPTLASFKQFLVLHCNSFPESGAVVGSIGVFVHISATTFVFIKITVWLIKIISTK